MLMYVYIKIGQSFEVGHHLTKYSHDGTPYNQFYSESAWATPEEAAARLNYLNGGTGHPAWMGIGKEGKHSNPYTGGEI